MNSVEGRRRRPSLYALIGVVVLTVIGVALFVWGALAPNVTIAGPEGSVKHGTGVWTDAFLGFGGSTTSSWSTDSDGRRRLDLDVTNHSFAPVELLGVTVESIGHDEPHPPSLEAVEGLPTKVRHGDTATVPVTLDARASCTDSHGDEPEFQIVFEVRTASGLRRHLREDDRRSLTCDEGTLPAPGPGPAEPVAARTEITRAFAVAYDFAAPPDARRAAVEDPAGLEPVVERVMDGPYAAIAAQVTPHIVEVVFTSPTSAAVLYDMDGIGPNISGRVGEARFVDDHWKITRDTVCADLALAEVHCPRG